MLHPRLIDRVLDDVFAVVLPVPESEDNLQSLQAEAANLTEAIGLGGNLPSLVKKLAGVERKIRRPEPASTGRATRSSGAAGGARAARLRLSRDPQGERHRRSARPSFNPRPPGRTR